MFISPPWNTVESTDLGVISSTKTIKSEEIERLKTRFILLALPPSPPLPLLPSLSSPTPFSHVLT